MREALSGSGGGCDLRTVLAGASSCAEFLVVVIPVTS
jgi:hypothetical protein